MACRVSGHRFVRRRSVPQSLFMFSSSSPFFDAKLKIDRVLAIRPLSVLSPTPFPSLDRSFRKSSGLNCSIGEPRPSWSAASIAAFLSSSQCLLVISPVAILASRDSRNKSHRRLTVKAFASYALGVLLRTSCLFRVATVPTRLLSRSQSSAVCLAPSLPTAR